MRRLMTFMLVAAAMGAGHRSAEAQEPGAELLAVGEMAPDFALPGATRYGVLQGDVRLSDYLGETVVLAFFFKVRTRG